MHSATLAPSPLGWLRTRHWAGGAGLVTILALLLSACGGTGSGPATGTPVTQAHPTSTVNCSAVDQSTLHLVAGGELTVGSDTTYAPAEFVDANNPNQYDGYDMDFARELARRLCLTPHIETANFSAIITAIKGPALGQQPWDLSISSFTINSDRTKKVDMLPYLNVGESVLVPNGNPSNIHGVADLCGKTVSAQDGTTELQELLALNATPGVDPGSEGVPQQPLCGPYKSAKNIIVLHYASEEDVINQVINSRAVAAYQDQPVTGYYVHLHPGQLQEAYVTNNSVAPEGIVMRKDNPNLETAIRTALQQMAQDGTYMRILTAWGAQGIAYATPGT
jgi:polar amino acid transport system substrate-binding protein